MARNTDSMTIGRRNLIKGATATGALMAAVRTAFPAGAFAQAAGPETNKVTIGFIALTDSSPLMIAKEKKLFDKYGITDANIAKQASWGTTRDNIVLGSGAGGIDGALNDEQRHVVWKGMFSREIENFTFQNLR